MKEAQKSATRRAKGGLAPPFENPRRMARGEGVRAEKRSIFIYLFFFSTKQQALIGFFFCSSKQQVLLENNPDITQTPTLSIQLRL